MPLHFACSSNEASNTVSYILEHYKEAVELNAKAGEVPHFVNFTFPYAFVRLEKLLFILLVEMEYLTQQKNC